MRTKSIKQSGIYQITNVLNGDFYIGSSENIAVRWRQHRWVFTKDKSPTRSHLFNAVKKYGIENFMFSILEECEPIKEILLGREQFYIDSLLPIYNLLKVAGSRLGTKISPEELARRIGKKIHTDEHKAHLSERMTAYMNEPEIKEFYRSLRLGKDWTELFGEERSAEIRAKMSASRKLHPVVCAGWNAGIPMTEDHKAKFFAARDAWFATGGRTGFEKGHVPHNVGVPMTGEQKQALMDGLDRYIAEHGHPRLGTTHSEETKQHLSLLKKELFDPDHQAKMTEAARLVTTGSPRSDETKAKISASHKVSEARQQVYENRRGYEWTDEQRRQISESNKTSEKAVAYHQSRIGKVNAKSTHGNYGITWRNDSQKWCVKIRNKKYGSFKTIEEAIVRRDEVLATMQQQAA